MDLLTTTLDLARKADKPVGEICRAANVTPRWYHMLLAGQIRDPSVRRIQRLHDFLAAHEAGAGKSDERQRGAA